MKLFCNEYVEELTEKNPPNISEASCVQGGTSFGARRGTASPFTPGPHLRPNSGVFCVISIKTTL